MGKGSEFEREICKSMSKWWTDGERDDVFWRSSISGGRATIRGKQGKTTAGGYGDLTAIDPIGQPLIDLCTIELKRGYGATICDMLDAGPVQDKQKFPQKWEGFVKQAIEDQEASGRPFWVLITKRDRYQPVIYIPHLLFQSLSRCGVSFDGITPWFKFRPKTLKRELEITVFATQLDMFFDVCSSDSIVRCLKHIQGDKRRVG